MERYDVVVVGVGGMGSAALHHLARRGRRVLGLERFDVPHEHGSSHGHTRIIRLAYFEHPAYVPLMRRAYELWRELQDSAGEQLLHVTGIVEGGPTIYDGVLRSCAEHDLSHETLTGAEVTARFPGYGIPADMPVVFQAEGGFVLPERCIVAHVEAAQRDGAVVRARERVLEWDARENGVRVRTDRGVVEAERNRDLLARATVPVLLEVKPEIAAGRCRADPTPRPPLAGAGDPLEEARRLHARRAPWWHALAAAVVDASRTVEEVVRDVADAWAPPR